MILILIGLIGIAIGISRIAEGIEETMYQKRRRIEKRRKRERRYDD